MEIENSEETLKWEEKQNWKQVEINVFRNKLVFKNYLMGTFLFLWCDQKQRYAYSFLCAEFAATAV